MCQPQPGPQPIAGGRDSRESGVPRLWPGPQGCMLSDLARLAEGTKQPGEESAEREEKPSAALPLPSQLIRGTTGAREAGPGSRRSDCQGHSGWHQPSLQGACRLKADTKSESTLSSSSHGPGVPPPEQCVPTHSIPNSPHPSKVPSPSSVKSPRSVCSALDLTPGPCPTTWGSGVSQR